MSSPFTEKSMLYKYQEEQFVRGKALGTVGCGDWIVLLSVLGHRVAFHLSGKCWYEHSANS